MRHLKALQLELPTEEVLLRERFTSFYKDLVAFQSKLTRKKCERCQGFGHFNDAYGHGEKPTRCSECSGFGYIISHDGKRYYARNREESLSYYLREFDLQ